MPEGGCDHVESPHWSRLLAGPVAPCRERTPHQSRWNVPKGGCDRVESPCWSRVLAGALAPCRERSPHWSRFAGRACDLMGDPRWSSLFSEGRHPLQRTAPPAKDPRCGSLGGTVSCERELALEQGKNVSRKEWQKSLSVMN